MDISLLSCPLCLKPHFEGVDALRSSLINVATTHISCPVCNELLLGLDKLTIHLFSHINTITQAYLETTSTNVKTVVESINQNIDERDTSFSTSKAQNLPSVIEIENNFVRCDICNYYFSDENILGLHQKLLHQTTPDKKTGKYNYHCHLCSKQFKMRGSLMVHMRVAHFAFIQSSHKNTYEHIKTKQTASNKVKCDQSNNRSKISDTKQAEKKFLSSSPKSQENKQWECEVCLKLFTTKYFLKKHKRLHTGEMPYFCSLCNKYFTFQQSYHKHMLYHSDDKPHVCTECGRAFKELSTLHNHQRIHSGERPFSCETCGKSFRQRVSYLVHRRIHTGVMPYKCTACNKSFRYKVSQRSHKCPSSVPGMVIKTTDFPEQTENCQPSRYDLSQNSAENNNAEEVQSFTSTENVTEPNEEPPQSAAALNVNHYLNVCKLDQDTSKNSANYNFNDDLENSVGISFTPSESNPDFFSMILSPVLSDVQSLCLSNYTDKVKRPCDNEGILMEEDVLETINEESFKELLYGP